MLCQGDEAQLAVRLPSRTDFSPASALTGAKTSGQLDRLERLEVSGDSSHETEAGNTRFAGIRCYCVAGGVRKLSRRSEVLQGPLYRHAPR